MNDQKADRLASLKQLYQSVDFSGRIYMIGKGAVGTCLLYMIMKIFKIKANQITIIDVRDIISELPKEYLDDGLVFVNQLVEIDNYQEIFRDVKPNDLIIDCSVDISTTDMMKLCQEKECIYINSSIETWDHRIETDPVKFSVYARYSELLDYSDSLGSSKRFNAITGCGMNPGTVSIWVKAGLDKINDKYKYSFNSYGELAQKLGVRTVHISEVDTQRTNAPKERDEYCNTWSTDAEGFYEEALAPIELSWGTHEKTMPEDVALYMDKKRYMVINKLCVNQFAQSYCPISKNFLGMLIRHEENFTIGETLTVMKDGICVYKPSVYYVYQPCDNTMASLHELKSKNYHYQTNYRLLTSEIIDGQDEIGLTFFLENGDIYWIGSLLDIDEAREIYNHEMDDRINATLVQVVAGYISGIFYLLELMKEKKYLGVLSAEDIPHRGLVHKMRGFYGDFGMMKVRDWDYCRKNRDSKFLKTERIEPKISKCEWRYEDFIL